MTREAKNPYEVIRRLQASRRAENPFIWQSVANAFEAFTDEALPEDLPRNAEERAILKRVFYSLTDLWQTVGLRSEGEK